MAWVRTDAYPRFVDAVARAFWLDAYARAGDEGDLIPSAPTAGPGEDWDDVAPPTPRKAREHAIQTIGRWEGKAGHCASTMLASLARANGRTWYSDNDPDWGRIGHEWAMMAMGHGVSLWDDGRKEPADHWAKPPYSEAPSLCELAPRYLRKSARLHTLTIGVCSMHCPQQGETPWITPIAAHT